MESLMPPSSLGPKRKSYQIKGRKSKLKAKNINRERTPNAPINESNDTIEDNSSLSVKSPGISGNPSPRINQLTRVRKQSIYQTFQKGIHEHLIF